uniref:U6 snRNA-associated Sm-like protein LSm4 n=1 Tax=Aureoumbra lagunensis TaxID=44058 RepID=A0A7S3K442_9STRA|mmetsp:Transcript_3157/g.4388  ORF Transcript_3157/g.4388 Transcript_3157/m.4388 type:complete len:150 (+) Transcript_3157:79-528(+)
MLPLSLLSAAKGNPMLIELKNGDTYNGRLVSSDSWMNINLQDVICTSREGDRFWELKECYIRGSAIKYLRIPDEVLDAAQEDEAHKEKRKGFGQRGRVNFGRGGGRGRGAGRGGGRGRDGGRGRGRGDVRGRSGGENRGRGRGINSKES